MRRTTLASLLLILALAGLALQQAPACFSGRIPDVKLLKGDLHAVDLDGLMADSKPEFKIGVDIEGAEEVASLITTFNDFSPNEYVLNETIFGKVNRCTAYSQGLSDGDWAFLCDSNKIVFVSVNETLGAFDPQRTIVINLAVTKEDETLACDSIRNGGTQNLYAVCQKPGSDSIYIFTLDLAAPVRQEPDIIEQPKTEYKLVAPFKLSVNEYLTDAGQQISIFIHEREPKTNQLHFRMFKFAKGKLIDGGYFSTLIQGSIRNGQDGQLQSVFVNDEFSYLQTRKNNQNFLQRCLRNPIYSTFVCEESFTKLAEGDYRIKFFYVDKTKRTTKMVWVYYVSATEIKIELFDPDTDTYIPDVEKFQFVGHSLKRVVDFQRAGNNVYLIGPTSADKLDIADGVVKFKTKTNTWEEFSYGPDASLGLVMQDLHETHFANYLSVGNNKINFNRIKKNILIYNTELVDDQSATLKVTVSCTGLKGSKSSLTFNVYTQLSVNSDDSIRVSVPSVEAYVGSSFIYLPTNGDEISGNAPTLKSIDAGPLVNVTTEFLMLNPEQLSYEATAMEGITGLKHVGESWFAIENSDTLSFFQCLKGSKGLKCKDSQIAIDLKTPKLVHIHTEINDGIALVLLSQKVPEDDTERQNAVPKTVIQAIRLEDGQKEFEDKTYDFYTKVGRVRVLDQIATLVMAGANKFSANVDMHQLRFNMSSGKFPTNVGSLTSFHSHICPSQISWAPRSSNVVYVSSVCDKSGIDNHVFKYEIDFDKPFLSAITEVYVVEGSRDFNICAQDRLLNIIDMERDVFYSFDTQSSINAKLYFPTKQYGIKELKTYSCDQNNNILQIVGCTDNKYTDCYLMTYKANLAHVPNKRVHSVQKIDPATEFIASSFNDVNDDTITLLFGKSTQSAKGYSLEVDGPHIRLKAATQESDGGVFKIIERFAFLGENGVLNDDNLKVIPSEHNLTLVAQPVDVNMHLTKPQDKLLMDGTPQPLEDYVTITGPFHSIAASDVEGAVVVDRMSEYAHFTNLETTFTDAMYHKDFVFGYKKDGLTAVLGVYSVGKKHLEIPSLDSVSDLQFVAKSDNEFYFFALVRKTYKKDRIYTIYTKNGGQTWATAHTSLDTEGYKIMEINNGPGEYFSFGGYNNLRGYKSVVFAFRVDGKDIVGSAPNPYKFEDNIADYDINFFEGTRYVIVVAGVEYAKQAEFFWYEIDESGYMNLIGQQRGALVPNVQETHEDVVFRCEQRNNSKDFLWCINSGKNLYSYFVKYQLDWTKPTTGLARNFITKSIVHTKLRNVVNLKPIKVDLLGDYISFMVRNLDPVRTGAVRHPGAFFADSHMCLTYKISSNIDAVEDQQIPTRDVFKILTMGDLEITDLKLLENLDPRYFNGPDNLPKLGINVGTSGKSIKVFNVNGLSITLDDTKDAHKNFIISFRTIKDGQISKFAAKDFFDIRKKPEPPVGGPCFKGGISNVKLLKGDIHAIDVDLYLIDNQVTLTATTNNEKANDWLSPIKTFNWEPSDYALNETLFGKVNTCTSYSQGLSDGDWVFLCDQNKIVFVSVNETTGFFDEQRTTVVNLVTGASDAETTCDSIRNGGTQNLYAICSRPDSSNIYVYSIDLAAPTRRDPDVIMQPEASEKLKAPFKLWVDEYNTDAGAQVVLILHEREPTTPELKFKMLKNRKGKLVDGGYFSTELPKTMLNAQKGQLQSVFVNDEFIILQTKAGNKNYLQRCLRNPIYSQFKCDKSVTELSDGDYRIKLFYVDKTKRTTHMTWIYYVSTERIKFDLYDPDTNSYTADIDSIEFKGHSLRRVVDYQRAGNNFFLIGPTKDLNVADGLVKVKTQTNTWEEYSYGPNASLGLVMQDLHETHYANYLAVGFNQIMFRRIRKNILQINTATASTETEEVEFSLQCKGELKNTESTLKFKVSTQSIVNDDSSIRVAIPDVETYVGSAGINVPLNDDEFSGNAPILKDIEIPLKNTTYEYLMVNQQTFDYQAREIKGISAFKFVGENYFAVENSDELSFFYCDRDDKEKLFCKNTVMTFPLKNEKNEVFTHIHTEVSDGIALIVMSTVMPTDETLIQKSTPKTIIRAVRLEDSQMEFDPQEYPFYAKLGRVRILDQQATIILAGANSFVGSVDMHYLNFNMALGKFPKNLGTLTSFKNHICPAQISWGPRGSNVLYVSSICDKNGLNNHVFKYDIDFEKPFRSQITEVYVVEGSRDFRICAQERLLNIVDMEQDLFYSFDTKSSINAKLYFPTQVYGIKEIKTYSCDQNNNILQIVGCTTELTSNTCHLLTYRANLAHIPNKRVHSVQKIDNNVEFIASSFNDEDDETFTFMLGKTTDTKYLFDVEVDGPHLRFKADTENSEGKFLIKETFAFLGENGVLNDDNRKLIATQHQLILTPQPTEVKMALVDPTKKMKLDGSLQQLEEFVTITGPYHSLVQDAGSKVQLIDRMTPTKQFDTVKKTWIDAMFHKDFIFGFAQEDGQTFALSVYQNNTERTTVPGLDSVSDLQFVAKSDNEFYFFALVRKTYKKDRIYTIYTKNGGQTWATAQTSLDSEGYNLLEIKNSPTAGTFIFGGYNNIRGYKITVFAFRVDGSTISGTAPNPYMLSDNIVDFDVTFFEGTRYVIVVAGMEYSKQASFLWYELDDSGYLNLIGEQRSSLVPNQNESHEGIVFKCEQRGNSTEYLWCINSGKNMYSYLTKYQLDWTKPTTGLARNFIKSTKVETKFRNIVNLRPISLDANEDYITFIVKNMLPQSTQLTGPAQPGSLFTDSFMSLTYKVNVNAVKVNETEIPVRDVFKILSKEDLGVKDDNALKNLSPRYFKDTDGKTKLGINVGVTDKSIKVFNLNTLAVIANGQDESQRKFTIKLRTIDNKRSTDFKADDFFEEYKGQVDPEKPNNKGKSTLTLVMIICIVVVLIVLGVVGFIVSQKPKSGLEDPIMDDVEKTMKLPDETAAHEDSKL